MVAPPTVVKQSGVARNGLFIFLETACVLAYVRGVPGAATTAGAYAAATFTTAAGIGIGLLWRQSARLRSQLEISDEEIAIVVGVRAVKAKAFAARDGNQLRFEMRGGYRYKNLCLARPATNERMVLPWYSKKPIKQACEAHGWRFGDG